MTIGGNFQAGKTLIAESMSNIADENSTITQKTESISPELVSMLSNYPHVIEQVKALQEAIIKKEPSKIKALIIAIHNIAPSAIKVISTFFASPLAGLGIMIDQVIGGKPNNG
jgi:hypothetical protein